MLAPASLDREAAPHRRGFLGSPRVILMFLGGAVKGSKYNYSEVLRFLLLGLVSRRLDAVRAGSAALLASATPRTLSGVNPAFPTGPQTQEMASENPSEKAHGPTDDRNPTRIRRAGLTRGPYVNSLQIVGSEMVLMTLS